MRYRTLTYDIVYDIVCFFVKNSPQTYDVVRFDDIVYDIVRQTYDVVYDIVYDIVRPFVKNSIFTYDVVYFIRYRTSKIRYRTSDVRCRIRCRIRCRRLDIVYDIVCEYNILCEAYDIVLDVIS
jgi:hypothetical protein